MTKEANTQNSPAPVADTGFGKLNLKAENHVVAPGRYLATISHVRLLENRDGDTLWLTIMLELHSENGEALGQVEDRFLTIAARPTSPNLGRVREGLKRLALYGIAADADLDNLEPTDIGGKLVGQRIRVVISRRGTGVQAENGISAVLKADK